MNRTYHLIADQHVDDHPDKTNDITLVTLDAQNHPECCQIMWSIAGKQRKGCVMLYSSLSATDDVGVYRHTACQNIHAVETEPFSACTSYFALLKDEPYMWRVVFFIFGSTFSLQHIESCSLWGFYEITVVSNNKPEQSLKCFSLDKRGTCGAYTLTNMW